MAKSNKPGAINLTDDPASFVPPHRKSDEIYNAIYCIQQALDVIVKDATNPHFESSYASLENVWKTLKPLLLEYKVGVTQLPGAFLDGCLSVTTILFSTVDGSQLETTLRVPVPPKSQHAQGIGSAITYARRYSLVSMFSLPVADDDGNAAVSDRPRERDVPQQTIESDLLDRMIAAVRKCVRIADLDKLIAQSTFKTSKKTLTDEEATLLDDEIDDRYQFLEAKSQEEGLR